ncbi:MAG: FliM/FliN family flagellar motor switch protein [Myxococcales bacterium]
MTAALNTEELNALMSAIQESRVPTAPGALPGPTIGGKAKSVVPYDLTSQDRIIRGQLPTLDAINERVASMLAAGLSGRTRLQIRVGTTPATLLKFSDVNVLLAPPAVLAMLALGQGHGMGVGILEPGLGESLLAAALGDRKLRKDDRPAEVRHELTTVEKLVLRRLLSVFTDAMATAWADVLPLRPEVVRFESDPRMATVAPSNDVALLSSFELTGAIAGRFQLAFPFASVEAVRKQLASPPRTTYGSDDRFATELAAELEQVKVDVCAILGGARIRLERLLELEAGDVISLSADEGSPLTVAVQGRPKLTGFPTVVNSSLSMIVERDLQGRTPPRPPAANTGPASPVTKRFAS